MASKWPGFCVLAIRLAQECSANLILDSFLEGLLVVGIEQRVAVAIWIQLLRPLVDVHAVQLVQKGSEWSASTVALR